MPEYLELIHASLDARHIWFSLQKLNDNDSNTPIASLGAWAEKRLAQLDSGLTKQSWLSPDNITNDVRVKGKGSFAEGQSLL